MVAALVECTGGLQADAAGRTCHHRYATSALFSPLCYRTLGRLFHHCATTSFKVGTDILRFLHHPKDTVHNANLLHVRLEICTNF